MLYRTILYLQLVGLLYECGGQTLSLCPLRQGGHLAGLKLQLSLDLHHSLNTHNANTQVKQPTPSADPSDPSDVYQISGGVTALLFFVMDIAPSKVITKYHGHLMTVCGWFIQMTTSLSRT